MSKNQIKLIRSLSQKKFRQKHGLFKVEGIKAIQEMIKSGWTAQTIYTTTDLFAAIDSTLEIINDKELKQISSFKNPQTAVALFSIPKSPSIESKGLSVVLDGVRDPGNLGTIIRLCDWFGVSDLVCSPDTVDGFNPKVIQSTMGSIARVVPHYKDLSSFFQEEKRPVFGADMNGQNSHTFNFPENAVLVLGNEAKGLRPETETHLNHRIAIPQFGQQKSTESLNVASAGAILMNDFRR